MTSKTSVGPGAASGRAAELLALANRLGVTKAIRGLQERGLTAEETAAKLSLNSPSALDMVKVVRGEAIQEKTNNAPAPEPAAPQELPVAPRSQVNEGHPPPGAYSAAAPKATRSVKIQKGSSNSMNLVIKFEHEKETKGTHRFKEITEDGKPAAVGTLYIRKEALPTPVPGTIEVTIKS